jgi:ABC-type nickel/cobalt efflux system permease component RcnA
MVLVLGVRLLMLRYRGASFIKRFAWSHRHSHHAEHDHDHPDSHDPPAGSPWKGLIALGLADGLTPSPSALVVLLAAVSLDRIGLGMLLIVAFSVGLAAVLTLISLAFVYLRRIVDWISARPAGALVPPPLVALVAGKGPSRGPIAAAVPTLGALALMAVGLMLTIRAVSSPNLPF